MNKQIIAITVTVIGLGVVGVVLANVLAEPDAGGTEIRTTEQVVDNPTPAVQARANTFGIMTPEEAAEAEAAAEAARLAAEAAASSTASSTDEEVDESEETES